MKKFLIISLLLIFSCGPSEEEIQERIDEAVEVAISNIEDNTTTTTTIVFELEVYKRAWCITESQEIINFHSNRFSYFSYRPNSLKTVIDVFTYISEVGGDEESYNGITELVSSGLALFTVSDLLDGYLDGDIDSLKKFNTHLEAYNFILTEEICNVWYETVNSE